MHRKSFFVYILTNKTRSVLYTGITSDLERRLWQHRNGFGSAFVFRYRAHNLVHYELFARPRLAIAREKQIKSGSRAKKVKLIESHNPEWNELAPMD